MNQKSYCVAHLVKRAGLGYWPLDRVPSGMRLMDSLQKEYLVLNVQSDPDEALRRRAHGFKFDGQLWTMADYVIRDGEGATFFMYPECDQSTPRDPEQFRNRLSRRLVIDGVSDLLKGQKYLKREYAPHKSYVEGYVIEELEDGFICALQSPEKPGWWRKTFVRTPLVGSEIEPYVDGMGMISEGFSQFLTGERMQFGGGVRLTVDTPTRFYKGHYVVRDLRWDAVLFCGKKQLVTTDGQVRFALMTELHDTPCVYSDLQSMINFRYADRMIPHAEKVMTEFLEVMNGRRVENADGTVVVTNPEVEVRTMLTTVKRSIDESLADRDRRRASGESVDDAGPTWSLIQAMEADLPLTRLPFTRDKLLRFFDTELCNLDQFRVRFDESVYRRYLMVDPFAFDLDGNFTPATAALKGNQWVIPGKALTTAAFLYPQPSASWNEGALGCLVDHPRFHGADPNSPFIFIAIDELPQMFVKCGGRDLDDSSVIHTDPGMVRHGAEVLSVPYPGTKVSFATGTKATRKNRFLAATAVEPDACVQADVLINMLLRDVGETIASLSNSIMLDNNNVANSIQDAPALAEITPNLELIIDIKKKGGSAEELAFFKTFTEKAEAARAALTKCSHSLLNRVPGRHRDHVVGVETDLDRLYEALAALREEFYQAFYKTGLDRLETPKSLYNVSTEKRYVKLAKEMVAFFHAKVEENIGLIRARLINEASRLYVPGIGYLVNDEYSEKRDALVLAKIEKRASIEGIQQADEEMFVRYDKHPDRPTAWAYVMKDLLIDRRRPDMDKMKAGILGQNWSIQWTIEAWKELESVDHGWPTTRKLDLVDPHVVSVAEKAAAGRVRMPVNTSVSKLVCADGWKEKGVAEDDAALVAWRSCVKREVTLVDSDFRGIPTVEVLLEGKHYAWVRRSDAAFVDGRTKGYLVPHMITSRETGKQVRSAYSMCIVFSVTFGGKEAASAASRPFEPGVLVNGWSKHPDQKSWRDVRGAAVLFPVEYNGKEAYVAFVDSDEIAGLCELDLSDTEFRDYRNLETLTGQSRFAWLAERYVPQYREKYGPWAPVIVHLGGADGYSRRIEKVEELVKA